MVAQISPILLKKAIKRIEELALKLGLSRAGAFREIKNFPGLGVIDVKTINQIVDSVYNKLPVINPKHLFDINTNKRVAPKTGTPISVAIFSDISGQIGPAMAAQSRMRLPCAMYKTVPTGTERAKVLQLKNPLVLNEYKDLGTLPQFNALWCSVSSQFSASYASPAARNFLDKSSGNVILRALQDAGYDSLIINGIASNPVVIKFPTTKINLLKDEMIILKNKTLFHGTVRDITTLDPTKSSNEANIIGTHFGDTKYPGKKIILREAGSKAAKKGYIFKVKIKEGTFLFVPDISGEWNLTEVVARIRGFSTDPKIKSLANELEEVVRKYNYTSGTTRVNNMNTDAAVVFKKYGIDGLAYKNFFEINPKGDAMELSYLVFNPNVIASAIKRTPYGKRSNVTSVTQQFTNKIKPKLKLRRQ